MRATHKTSNIVPIRNELIYWFNWTKCGGLNTNTAPLPLRTHRRIFLNSHTPGLTLGSFACHTTPTTHTHTCTCSSWFLHSLPTICICFHTYFARIVRFFRSFVFQVLSLSFVYYWFYFYLLCRTLVAA